MMNRVHTQLDIARLFYDLDSLTIEYPPHSDHYRIVQNRFETFPFFVRRRNEITIDKIYSPKATWSFKGKTYCIYLDVKTKKVVKSSILYHSERIVEDKDEMFNDLINHIKISLKGA